MGHEKITPETEVSTTELACVLGITGRYIRQLVEDGQLDKIDRGRFNLCDSVQRYIKFASRETVNEDDAKLDRSRRIADTQLKAAKATIAKMEAEEIKGNMHRSEDVAAMTEDLIFTIRGMLIALPGRLGADTCSPETAAEASEIIRKEVYVVLNELSRYEYDPVKYEDRVRARNSWESLNKRDSDEE